MLIHPNSKLHKILKSNIYWNFLVIQNLPQNQLHSMTISQITIHIITDTEISVAYY